MKGVENVIIVLQDGNNYAKLLKKEYYGGSMHGGHGDYMVAMNLHVFHYQMIYLTRQVHILHVGQVQRFKH